MHNKTAQPGPGDHVLALCHMLSNRIGKGFAGELDKFGVSVAQWRVVLTLASGERASGREITSRWAMDKMAVNRAIARLQRNGLVEKRQSTTDRRNIDVRLTPSGRALYDKMLPATTKRYHELMACLDASEKAALRMLLTKMILHFDALSE